MTRGRPTVVLQRGKNSVKAMSDGDNEGQEQIADVLPAPDPSNEATKDASELQEAAAKKKLIEKAEKVSGSWDPTTVYCKFIKNEITRLAKKRWPKAVSAQYILARRGPLI
jgi:hypothetical protein